MNKDIYYSTNDTIIKIHGGAFYEQIIYRRKITKGNRKN